MSQHHLHSALARSFTQRDINKISDIEIDAGTRRARRSGNPLYVRVAYRDANGQSLLFALLNQFLPPHRLPVTWGERRVPLSHGRHHGGRVSAFFGEPLLRTESHLERLALQHFAGLPGCKALLTQPLTIRFWYRGSQRRYTPDLLVLLDPVPVDLSRAGFDPLTLIEVKPLHARMDLELWTARACALREALRLPLVRFPFTCAEGRI